MIKRLLILLLLIPSFCLAQSAGLPGGVPPTWNSGTTYTIGSQVNYQGGLYVSIQQGSNENPQSATSFWTFVLGVGAFTTTGSSGAATYNSATGALNIPSYSGGGSCTNALTLNNAGSGASSGSTFNCSAPITLSYNTLGAAPAASPSFTGTVTLGASGTLVPLVMGNGSTGTLTLEPVTGALGTVTVSIPAATDTLVNLAGAQTLSNKTFVAPALGAATATSLLATGIVDGEAPVTITTGTTGTPGGTYNSGYTINHEATAATAVTYTLPTAAVGKQYCVKNGNNGSAADTGVLTIQVSAAGQSIVYNGTAGASNGNLVSGGAAGDAACVLGISSTQWEAFVQAGTWAVH